MLPRGVQPFAWDVLSLIQMITSSLSWSPQFLRGGAGGVHRHSQRLQFPFPSEGTVCTRSTYVLPYLRRTIDNHLSGSLDLTLRKVRSEGKWIAAFQRNPWLLALVKLNTRTTDDYSVENFHQRYYNEKKKKKKMEKNTIEYTSLYLCIL